MKRDEIAVIPPSVSLLLLLEHANATIRPGGVGYPEAAGNCWLYSSHQLMEGTVRTIPVVRRHIHEALEHPRGVCG